MIRLPYNYIYYFFTSFLFFYFLIISINSLPFLYIIENSSPLELGLDILRPTQYGPGGGTPRPELDFPRAGPDIPRGGMGFFLSTSGLPTSPKLSLPYLGPLRAFYIA